MTPRFSVGSVGYLTLLFMNNNELQRISTRVLSKSVFNVKYYHATHVLPKLILRIRARHQVGAKVAHILGKSNKGIVLSTWNVNSNAE